MISFNFCPKQHNSPEKLHGNFIKLDVEKLKAGVPLLNLVPGDGDLEVKVTRQKIKETVINPRTNFSDLRRKDRLLGPGGMDFNKELRQMLDETTLQAEGSWKEYAKYRNHGIQA